MIPIMEREFVDKNKWMDKQEFMDIMVVAQTTPGIFAIDMASHIGYKLKGVWGGIVGAIGIALPSIIAILIIQKPAMLALRDYERQKKLGLDPVFDPDALGIKNADFWRHRKLEQSRSE